jgi:hypothetical protein
VKCMTKASVVTIEGAAHFMLSTHAKEVARQIAQQVDRAGTTKIRSASNEGLWGIRRMWSGESNRFVYEFGSRAT